MNTGVKKSSLEQGQFFKKVYLQVKKIPYGQVSTYGEIAKQIGFKHYARHVGYALNAVKKEDGVPWHRVVNAHGKISLRKEGLANFLQKELLKQEGVVFDDSGKINLNLYRWRPQI
ncbi:MAG TPA: MGMT family protein [Oligoflexia bacterium]|nr:MGMT family protein [Oligoflexia bacterium]HMR25231.1 MGMT family protein [Oligoflexia bacterium]